MDKCPKSLKKGYFKRRELLWSCIFAYLVKSYIWSFADDLHFESSHIETRENVASSAIHEQCPLLSFPSYNYKFGQSGQH